MSTIKQSYFKKTSVNYRSRSAALMHQPNKQGEILQLRIVTPRKPNSARRPCAKIVLSNNKKVVAHLPGIGHNLRKHSDILLRGRGPRDLPGVRHSCTRGVYDFLGVKGRSRRRSIFGVPRPEHKILKARRKFRKLFQ